ncbi:MAG: translation initiation factor IF-2 subunit alpha [Halobacteria archaeon]
MKYTGWPEPSELVVCKVDNVEDFGAFCKLVEYDDKEGLIHVSEVASGWVKHIRDHVRDGKTVVCKVLEIDEDSQQIDLSLKDVNDHQAQDKIQEWKNEQKADKWLSMAIDDDETITEVASKLIQKHGTMYDALEEGAIHGVEVFENAGISDDLSQKLVEVARENINVPYVNIKGYVDLETQKPEGVNDIRQALQSFDEDDVEAEVSVEYVSAPEYCVSVKAHDYKTAETVVEKAAESIIDTMESLGGSGAYHTDSRKADT